jgi:hypothetical protein
VANGGEVVLEERVEGAQAGLDHELALAALAAVFGERRVVWDRQQAVEGRA